LGCAGGKTASGRAQFTIFGGPIKKGKPRAAKCNAGVGSKNWLLLSGHFGSFGT
jgi:hypothetical protein